MLVRFDHVTIAVHSLAPAVADYTRLLGAEPTWRGTHPELGTQSALFGLGNALIELVSPAAAQADGLRAWLAERGEGLQAMAFGCDDGDGTRAALRARGVLVTPPLPNEARGDDGSLRHHRTLELSPRQTRGLSVFAVERSDTAALRGEGTRAEDRIEALDHVVVRTRAPDAAAALYAQGLGLRLALDRKPGEGHGARTRMLFFRVGGVTLEVVQDDALGADDAFYGLAYRVRDLGATCMRLRAAGFAVSEVRAGNKPGTHVMTVRDGTHGVPTLVLRDPAREAPRSGPAAG